MLWSAREWARVKATGDDMVNLVHEATNDTEKWGPTGPQMEKICHAFNGEGRYAIVEELEYRIRHAKDSWRPCYKSLLVVDYLARNAKEERLKLLAVFKSLLSQLASSFYYTNSQGVDHGISVRERCKNILELLSDPALLQEERDKARLVKTHLDGGSRGFGLRPGSRQYGGGLQTPSPHKDSLYQRRDQDRSSLFHDETGVSFTRKEQQELDDSIVAMRLQREEELRTGLSAQQLEEMYARQARRRQNSGSSLAPSPGYRKETDEEHTMRLQREEMEQGSYVSQRQPPACTDRVTNANPTTTTPITTATTTCTTPVPTFSASPPKQEEKAPPTFRLDDLFSAPPPSMSNVQDPFHVPAQLHPFGGPMGGGSGPVPSENPGMLFAPPPTSPPSNPWGAAPSPSAPPGATPSVSPSQHWDTTAAPPASSSSWGAAPGALASTPMDLWGAAPSSSSSGTSSSASVEGLFSALKAGEGSGKGEDQKELWNCLEGFAKQRQGKS